VFKFERGVVNVLIFASQFRFIIKRCRDNGYYGDDGEGPPGSVIFDVHRFADCKMRVLSAASVVL